MSSRAMVRAWTSASGPASHAIELLSTDAQVDLKKTLLGVGAESADASFLVLPVGAMERRSMGAAIAAYARATSGPRLCLAGTRSSLEAIGDTTADCDRVGWMLDGVDADTPLSQLAWDRIEALRFDADFVALAGRELRHGCILEAMLALAHDLGLCTLGPDAPLAGFRQPSTARFDFLPSGQTRRLGGARVAARELSTARGR